MSNSNSNNTNRETAWSRHLEKSAILKGADENKKIVHTRFRGGVWRSDVAGVEVPSTAHRGKPAATLAGAAFAEKHGMAHLVYRETGELEGVTGYGEAKKSRFRQFFGGVKEGLLQYPRALKRIL